MTELRKHIVEELAESEGLLVIASISAPAARFERPRPVMFGLDASLNWSAYANAIRYKTASSSFIP
jgi:hypothetical protein